jgi:ribosomal protein L19E
MKQFIKVTDADKSILGLIINVNKIQCISQVEGIGHTAIEIDEDQEYHVKETPDEIYALIYADEIQTQEKRQAFIQRLHDTNSKSNMSI